MNEYAPPPKDKIISIKINIPKVWRWIKKALRGKGGANSARSKTVNSGRTK